MPYDSNGIFNLVGGYQAVTGQTIQASQHNPPLEDIAAALSQVLLRSGLAPMTGNLPMGGFRITGMANGIAPSDGATVAQSGVPIGTVLDFAGATAPVGFLLCFGQAVSRSTYAALFSAIGTTFGLGDGSTTFNLPDCRGRVVAGKDDMGGVDAGRLSGFFGAVARSIGGVMGAASHILTIGQMPFHNHNVNDPGHTHNYFDKDVIPGNAIDFGTGYTLSESTRSTGSASSNISIQHSGGDQAHTNTQPTIIMNKIIKAVIS